MIGVGRTDGARGQVISLSTLVNLVSLYTVYRSLTIIDMSGNSMKDERAVYDKVNDGETD